jgi:MFS transporter, MHS family, proline/betaine transporter
MAALMLTTGEDPAMTSAAVNPASHSDSSQAFRKVVSSAAIGQLIEWYDFVVFVYSAGTIAKLFFPPTDPIAGLLAAFAVYAVGFLMRPIGGLLFGSLGDRFGRRTVLASIIFVMGGATTAMGLLPTYASVGVLAPALLVACRLVQGLSAAGEAAGSNSFVAEHAPRHRRGFYVAFTYAFSIFSPVFAALFVLLITNSMSGEAYLSWGWRVPFLIAAPLALVGLYIRLRIDETPAFKATQAANRIASSPLAEAWASQKTSMAYCLAITSVTSLGYYTLAGYFISYLTTVVGLTSNQALISNCIALMVAGTTTIASAYLCDIVGRKPLLIGGLVLSVLSPVPGYMLASRGGLAYAIAGQSLIAFCAGLFWGPYPIAILELFPTRVRFTAMASSLNVGYALFGGTAPLVATWLIAQTGSKLAPAYYLSAVTLVVLVVASTMKESRNIALLREEDVH